MKNSRRLDVEKKVNDLRKDYLLLIILPVIFILLALIIDSPGNIMADLKEIILFRDVLLVDYLEVGGMAGTLVNVALVGLMSIFMIYLSGRDIDGLSIASIYTVIGFAFIGKNVLNIIPIYLGGILYSKIKRVKLKNSVIAVIFVTTLAPLVSEIIFHLGLEPAYAIAIGSLVGIIIGYIVNPLAQHMVNFHKGYNLYNIGFVGGVTGTVVLAVMRPFGIDIQTQSVLSSQYHEAILYFFLAFSLAMIVLGGLGAKDLVGDYKKLLAETGRAPNDFRGKYGYDQVLVNMGIIGLLATGYVLVSKGDLNGPTIAGIFTMMGFAASGKHPKNTIPILIGVYLAAGLSSLDGSGTSAIIAGLFGTTLAPLAGDFGPLAGIAAGFLHIAVGGNIIGLHGGVHLYNNGFAGGIVAATLLPLILMIKNRNQLD